MKEIKPTVKLLWTTALALSLCALCGCARHYVITLSNGTQIGANSKPHLKGGAYIFKDAEGHKSYIPAGRVTEIEPASMSRKQQTKLKFLPSGQ